MSKPAFNTDSDEINARIDADIDHVRKTSVVLRVIDADGNSVPNARVVSEQTAADFHFGANIFMLGGFPTPEENAAYERAFLGLFNAATVPFYWRGIEVERGKPRYTSASSFVARRPPPDVVVDFCESHGLRMHGHTLVWDLFRWSAPDWLSKTDAGFNAREWEARVREVGERYGHRIHRWDAVNEVLRSPERFPAGESCAMPVDYEKDAMNWGRKYFPLSARMDINEVSPVWKPEWNANYVAKIHGLIDSGCSIDGIGLQFHLFADDDVPSVLDGKLHRPENLRTALDNLAVFDRPLHVSEITLTSPGNTPGSQAAQAEAARHLYRIWFSHPAVDSITWWNVPDGGGAPGEDKLCSGLLNSDLSPKPAYEALRKLIHDEWRTRDTARTDAEGRHIFRGFRGDYRIEVDCGGQSFTHFLSTSNEGETIIRLPISR